MYTLRQTLADQLNLEELCTSASRELSEHREMFLPNSFYGNDWIYKIYAGIPDNHSLKVVIPHAPTTHLSNSVWDKELDTPLPSIACFSREDSIRYLKALHSFSAHSTKTLEDFASPFLYVKKILQKVARHKPARSGTIFFPSHSTPEVKDVSDFSDIACRLDWLRSRYDINPVRVCIYWQDFLNGHHIPFLERGMQIVSAGHAMNPLFLFRLFHLCSIHKYACSNKLGTSVPYAIAAGCTYFGIPESNFSEPAPLEGSDNTSHIKINEWLDSEYQTKIIWECCFQSPDRANFGDQQRIAKNCLGEKFLKSPHDLRLHLISIEQRFYNDYTFTSASTIGSRPDFIEQLRHIIKTSPSDYQSYLRLGFLFDSCQMNELAQRAWEFANKYSLYLA